MKCAASQAIFMADADIELDCKWQNDTNKIIPRYISTNLIEYTSVAIHLMSFPSDLLADKHQLRAGSYPPGDASRWANRLTPPPSSPVLSYLYNTNLNNYLFM